MNKQIAIFYHGLFFLESDRNPLPAAFLIIPEQMALIEQSGLLAACQEFHCGINGSHESMGPADAILPRKATITYHGLQCRNENRTIMLLEDWVKSHPGWNVLYLHSKGATHPVNHAMSDRWRAAMMHYLVANWRVCVQELGWGAESVGCKWMTGPQTPPGQSIWAGNFFWARSDFLATLPSITARARLKMSGIDAVESRYESEVWIGNGPRLPRVVQLMANGGPGIIP